MIKIHEFPRQRQGIGVARVADAVRKFAPSSVEWDTFELSEFCFIQGVNASDATAVRHSLEAGKKVFLIQHCHQTAPHGWEQFYKDCQLVASYQNLGVYHNGAFNFLHTPYGYDPELFFRVPQPRDLPVLTTGFIATSECIDKVWHACKLLDIPLHHTGRNFGWDTHYVYLSHLSDTRLREFLNHVQYVACLRQVEGFELMGVEALACGARPIVPTLPCYDWYEGHGRRVDLRGDVVAQVAAILVEEPEEIGQGEQLEIERKFAWPIIIKRMFSRLLEGAS